MPRYSTLSARFWAKVDTSGDCWLWTASTWRTGYGRFHYSAARGVVKANRLAYELTHGPIPDGLSVLHTCDTPACCNPAHLFLGTDLDNARDRDAKGRNGMAKLTAEQVRQIRARYAAGGISHLRLAKEYGVTRASIANLLIGTTYKRIA